MAEDTKTTATQSTNEPLPLATIEMEQADKLKIEQLSRENAQLRAELGAYKQLEAERDAQQKSARDRKSSSVRTEARALMQIKGTAGRLVPVDGVLSESECAGLERGKHFEFVPVS